MPRLAEHMSETVDKILADYRQKGALEEGELDNGVIELCKRHSCAVVELALDEYIEARGKKMDNPSAYLTHIISRISQEGVNSDKKKDASKDRTSTGTEKKLRQKRSTNENKSTRVGENRSSKRSKADSEFVKTGVDMPFGERKKDGEPLDLSRIFPSMSRGRGRG